MTLKKDILTSDHRGSASSRWCCGIAYPLVITGVSQVAFPGNANGQQVHVGGKLVASKIIGQSFADPVVNRKTGKPKLDANGNPVTTPDPRYFQTRPSGTVPADNAAATAFANLGPNDMATEQAIAANIKAYLALEKPYDPGLTRGQDPGRRRRHLGVGHRPGHLGGQRATSRPTASPRSATSRWPGRPRSSPPTPPGGGSASAASRRSTCVELNLALNRLGGR